jgi:hypothetical protein
MSKLQVLVESWIEDVNKEDSFTLQLFEKLLNTMFSFIKWAGIPFIIYLLIEVTRW